MSCFTYGKNNTGTNVGAFERGATAASWLSAILRISVAAATDHADVATSLRLRTARSRACGGSCPLPGQSRGASRLLCSSKRGASRPLRRFSRCQCSGRRRSAQVHGKRRHGSRAHNVMAAVLDGRVQESLSGCVSQILGSPVANSSASRTAVAEPDLFDRACVAEETSEDDSWKLWLALIFFLVLYEIGRAAFSKLAGSGKIRAAFSKLAGRGKIWLTAWRMSVEREDGSSPPQAPKPPICMKHVGNQTEEAICEDRIWVSLYGEKYHLRADCHGLRNARPHSVTSRTGCCICKAGVQKGS